MWKPFDQKKRIPEIEQEILDFWKVNSIFEKTLEVRENAEPFVFYEGPPTANGRPGIHHVMSRTFKDIVCRYQTMKGKRVLRKAGWDTHGLPVELQVEKELGLHSKQEIEQYGIEKFNAKCRESVWQYKEEWEKLTDRMGFWLDLEHPYITYSPEYIESVWWGLKQVWDKGNIYQDYKVVPYCPRCGTALSLAEVAQGYKDVTETSVYVKFALRDEPNAYILAWTTTPWTLPGNVALAVGGDIDYVAVLQGEETYYLAKDRLSVLEGEYKILKELKGSDLIGKRYQPLFDFVDLAKESHKDGYFVLAGDFVTTEDGTGVVHTAVMYGEEDFNLGKQADLPAIHTVNERGEFNELVPLWQGRFVKEAEKDIINHLEDDGSLYKREQTLHTYPFCWRCNTHLLYYARSSWFIRIDQSLRDRLTELNKNITWVPSYIRDGRFGKWLEGLRDWAISRERYWGTPLPIWICENDNMHRVMVGSYQELRDLATSESRTLLEHAYFDPHKPHIDEIQLTCPDCAHTMKRVPEVIDVWIDSGMMPYAQWHYPFENQNLFNHQFPADYIAEAIDQTRGWFNSLLILSALLSDEGAYRQVVCGGHILDEQGQKMSKSKGNIVDPWQAIEETGIDAIRFYFVSVNQPGDNKIFSAKAVLDVYRKTIMIWWNVTSFFLTYAEVDQWQVNDRGERTVLDEWILALTQQTTQKMDTSLSELDMFTASRSFALFIDDLSTWYLRRSRKRRDAAFYATLHEVLLKTSMMAAPIMPFISEAIYQAIKTEPMPKSVHLTNFPDSLEYNQDILTDMDTVRELVTLGHAVRSDLQIKVRQPLSEAIVVGSRFDQKLLEIIADELNVKRVTLSDQIPGGWSRLSAGDVTVGINPTITPELKEEGIVRELVRSLQSLRKKAGVNPGEQVIFNYVTQSELLVKTIDEYNDELCRQSYSSSITRETFEKHELISETVLIDGEQIWLGLVNAK